MNSIVSMGPMIVMDVHHHHQIPPPGWNGHPLPPPGMAHHHQLGHPFNPHGILLPGPPQTQMPINASMNRSQRCGVCRGCQCKPCGACTYCQDSPQFGGPGVKKQSCIERRCLRVLENRLQRDAPTFKARVGCNACEDCRMPDCQICLVCLDKRFFENRYMTGAMCAKKRCNNATSIELPAAAANHEFQQRQAQKRAYEATMEFHMKRRMEMANFMPQQHQQLNMPPQQQQPIPPQLLLQAPLIPPQSVQQQQQQQQQHCLLQQQMQPHQMTQVPPSLTPSSAATPPAIEGGECTPATPQLAHDDSISPPQSICPQQQQQQQGLMIDPRIIAQNNNLLSGFGASLPVMQPLIDQQQQQQYIAYPVSNSPLQLDYFTKAYYMDEFSTPTTMPNGDPFVPPSYAPDMKNAVVLQPL